jgi:hypothetical protein
MTASDISAALADECDRILNRLDETPKTRQAARASPDSPGIYTIWSADPAGLRDLELENKPGETPLMGRPLYVGKATDSTLVRLDKHFDPGDTGHSTARRTLASLLDLESRPRRTTIEHPTPKQLQTLVSNFDLTESADGVLSRWMKENLLVCAAASTFTPLRDLERAVGAVLRPPLDQDRPPMWTPNPWRPQVSEARGRLRDRARVAASNLFPSLSPEDERGEML